LTKFDTQRDDCIQIKFNVLCGSSGGTDKNLRTVHRNGTQNQGSIVRRLCLHVAVFTTPACTDTINKTGVAEHFDIFVS